jgi:NAD(P)H-hydrate epimerase
MIPERDADTIPWLTTAHMKEVDRLMEKVYQIDLPRMMENGGRALAHLARARFLGGDPRSKRVMVLAGPGGNGGGALVAARRLHNYGAEVHIAVTRPDRKFSPVAAHQLGIVRRLRLPLTVGSDEDPATAQAFDGSSPDLIVDGLIGYSLQGAPCDVARALIMWANASPAPTLALDVPSGVDATSGQAFDPAIRAAATLTLALPKQGLRAEGVRPHVGALYLADISVPPGLYATGSLSLDVGPIFAEADILQLI